MAEDVPCIVSAITGDMVETWWTWRHGKKGAIKWWRHAIIIATTNTKFNKVTTPTTTAEAIAITTAIIATTRRACLGDNDNPERCGSVELWKLSGAQEQQ